MKQVLCISAVILAALTFSLDTFAQPPGGGGRGQGGGQRQQGQGQGGQGQGGQGQFGQFGGGGGLTTPGTLLRNEEVIKLLDITADQTTKLTETLRVQRPAGDGGAPAAPTPAELRTRTETQWKSIGEILKPEQLKKFQEIYFQASQPTTPGPNAPAGAPAQTLALNVYLLAALDLTADQKEKINKITEERDTAARALTPLGQDASQEDRAARRTANTERNTKANDAIKAVLTDAQKKKFDELVAGAADVKTKLGIGQGGRGGAGAGGGNRGGGNRGNNN